MNIYPTLNQEGLAESWNENLQDDTTAKGTFNTGRPFTITYRTFDPLTLTHTIKKLTDASKVLLDDFYEANKTTYFYFQNPTTLLYHVLQFDEVPVFVADDDTNSWSVVQKLTQYTSVAIAGGRLYGREIYGAGLYGGIGDG